MVDADGKPSWTEYDFFREYFYVDYLYEVYPKWDADKRTALISVYYAFTSLSTVGFGDFHPRSDFERLFIAFGLLFGVAIFSYIMGKFIGILDEFKRLNEEIDEGDELTKFFQVFARFNGGKQINHSVIKKIEEFFEYKWAFDKNQAIDEKEELDLLYQLPSQVQDTLYSGFLFNDFLSKFQIFFRISKQSNHFKSEIETRSFYTWQDTTYRDFMMQILTKLEPRFYKKKTVIIDEMDEMIEILFVEKGSIIIGYEINK